MSAADLDLQRLRSKNARLERDNAHVRSQQTKHEIIVSILLPLAVPDDAVAGQVLELLSDLADDIVRRRRPRREIPRKQLLELLGPTPIARQAA